MPNELLREAISAAERALTGGHTLNKDYLERLLSDSEQLQSGGDADRTYLALLLNSIGYRDESVLVLRTAPESRPAEVNPALRNVEGMLAAVHGDYGQAKKVLMQALSAASESPSLRTQILANLAAVSLQQGSAEEAEAWAAESDANSEVGNLAAEILIISVRASSASARGDISGLRTAAVSLREASRSRVAELGTQHPQALVVVVNMANIEIMLARTEGSQERLKRAVSVLQAATWRLAAELGADHPHSLTAQASLFSAEVDLARADGSTQKMQQAIAALEAVSRRISLTLGIAHPDFQVPDELASVRLEPPPVAQDSVGVGQEPAIQAWLESDRTTTRRQQHKQPTRAQKRKSKRSPIPFPGLAIFFYIPLLALYLASACLILLVTAFFTTILCALTIPCCYILGLFQVLAYRPASLPQPHWPRQSESREPEEPEPGYFYGPAWADFAQVTTQAFRLADGLRQRGVGRVKSQPWFWSGLFITLRVLQLGAAGGMSLGMVLGSPFGLAVFAAIAVVNIVVVAVLFVVTRLTIGMLWVVETGLLRIRSIRTTCPHCYFKVTCPEYKCPQCERRHRDLRPGRYGTFRHRCVCGSSLPTLIPLRSVGTQTYCPKCKHPIVASLRRRQVIALPFIGAPGAGKTTLMYGVVKVFISTAASVTIEASDPATAMEFARIDHILSSGGTEIAKTALTRPEAQTFVLKSRRKSWLLQFFDAAGELFYSRDAISEFGFLGGARTLVLVIDPLSSDYFWNGLSSERRKELAPARSRMQSPDLALQLVIERMQVMGVKLETVRLAVAFTHADLVRDAWDEPIGSWAQNVLGLDAMIRSARHTFKEIEFFRTASAFQASGQMDSSIADLTQWLVDRNGIKLSGSLIGKSS